jgi:hypothetical protein
VFLDRGLAEVALFFRPIIRLQLSELATVAPAIDCVHKRLCSGTENVRRTSQRSRYAADFSAARGLKDPDLTEAELEE